MSSYCSDVAVNVGYESGPLILKKTPNETNQPKPKTNQANKHHQEVIKCSLFKPLKNK